MTLEEIRDTLNCQVLAGEEALAREVTSGCGADLMSDVLMFVKPGAALLTGLTSVQSVRTADVADLKAVIYVRGKMPEPEAIALAREKGIVLLLTRLPMFEACGRLYLRGLRGGSEVGEETGDVRLAPLHSTI